MATPAVSSAADDRPRKLQRRTLDDVASLIGAAMGSLALAWILYERVFAFSGVLGFVVCWYGTFIVLYAWATGLSNPRTAVVDRMASAAAHGGAAIVGLTLATTVGFIFVKAWPALRHVNFFTKDMAGVRPTSPLTQGGIVHAAAGSAIEVGIADQLRPVVSAAVEVGVNVAVGDGEREAAAHLDDGGDAPAVEDTTQNAVTAFAKVIGPVGQTHAKDVSLVSVAGAHFFRQVAVVLCQSLIRAVVELRTAKGLAIGVERVEGDVVTHAHGAGNLQAFVGSRLVRLQLQDGAEKRVGPPSEDIRSRTGGGGGQHRVIDVARKRQVVAGRTNVSRPHDDVLGDLPLD